MAIAAFLASVSVCPIVAKTAHRRETPNPVHLTKDGKKWVAATLRSLSLEEKVGQMLMGRCFLDYGSFESPDYEKLKDNLQKYHIGWWRRGSPCTVCDAAMREALAYFHYCRPIASG